MTSDPQGGRSSNRLLATLSPEALERLRPEVLETHVGQVIQEGDTAAPYVFFPDQAVMVSVVRTDRDGSAVEVGIIGGVGAVPLQSAFASLPSRSELIVQVPGPITRIRAEAVRQAFASEEAFREEILVYLSIYLDQVSQNTLCNRLHSLEARLAKWLMLSRLYTGTEALTLTHEFLSHMLGVRRAGVTVAINELAMDGLIEHGRGTINIVDREGLERRACECQHVLREGWERMMSTPPRSRRSG